MISLERRSIVSRLYRWSLAPRSLGRLAMAAACSWVTVVAATPMPPGAEEGTYWRFIIAMLGAAGGMLALITGGFVLGARFVAEPVSARAVKAHVDMGARAHESLVSREEFARIASDISDIREHLAALSGSKGKGRG